MRFVTLGFEVKIFEGLDSPQAVFLFVCASDSIMASNEFPINELDVSMNIKNSLDNLFLKK